MDVVQLCYVSVNIYNEEVNVVLKESYSLFTVYKDKDGDDLNPYQVSFKFQHWHKDRMLINKREKIAVHFLISWNS